ncbi:MAG TPA: ATP-binding protein [Pseudonocardia sp.]|jgi:anti-sigma regulatory factor (Ser/Thr protein kinase)|nr:ATP-binding protein [Pseudonocardia sp.]
MDTEQFVDHVPHVEFVHRSWPATPRQLGEIRAEVRGWLAPLRLTEGARQDLVLAVSEAVSNSIEHAYLPATADADVELSFWTDTQSVHIEITDHGGWRDPSSRPTGRGLGIPLMQRLTESVLIHYGARGTRVLLSHALPGDARPLPAEWRRPTSLQLPDAH